MATKSNSRKSSVKGTTGTDSGHKPVKSDDPIVQVRIISTDVEDFKKFVSTTPLEFACAGPRVSTAGVVTADVLMKESIARKAARPATIKVEIVADLSATTGARRAEVGSGNRFKDPSVLPTGRGTLLRKMP